MAKSSSAATDRSMWGKIWGFADERLGLKDLVEFAAKKEVPQHAHSFWYYLGGITLFFFVVQVITGILLLVYYRPGPEAYDSVRRITYDIDFGWLLRSTHSWSANLMVLALFVHLFSVYFMKAYRKPREFGWWTGLLLLGIVLTFGFSGYLLPMDELSFFATKVGLAIPNSTPVIGPAIVNLIRGGPEVGAETVQRFFALHVVILPALFLPILGVHLWLVQRHGNAIPPREESKPAEERRSIRFFPDFVVKDLAMWLIVLNVLGLFACLFTWDLGPKADALAPAPEGIHPEWYFMVQFQVLKVLGVVLPGTLGEIVGVLFFGIVGLMVALVPFYDTSAEKRTRARMATLFGVAVLVGTVVFTVWGYLAL